MWRWPGGAPGEARRLARDARRIIDQTVYGLPRPRLEACARRCREEISEARRATGTLRLGELRRRIEARHREARRLGDQGALTALTLALIDLRAMALGALGDQARRPIEAFLVEWGGAPEPSMGDPMGDHADYTPAEIEAQYDARGAVPEHAAMMAAWARRSAALRAASTTARLDLAYGRGARRRIDYFPGAARGAPLLAFLHGGYWQRGEHTSYAFLVPAFHRRGAAVALIGYPLCPQVTLDEVTGAARAACAWLAGHAAGLGFERRRMVVAGHSAGGHLAAMTVCGPGRAAPGAGPRAVLAVSGLYELEPLRRTSLNEAIGMDAAQARRNSPALLEPDPRAAVMVAVGGAESDEFRRQAARLVSAWDGRVAIGSRTIPGANHFTVLEALGEPGEPLHEAAVELLEGYTG